MKTLFTSFFVSFLIFGFTQEEKSKINIGFNSGPSISFGRGNQLIKITNPKISGYMDFSFNFNLIENLFLHSGVSYENKGFSSEITYTDNIGNTLFTAKSKSSTNYIGLPLLLEGSWGKKHKFFFNSGFSLQFLLATGTKVKRSRDVNFNQNRLKNFDIGLINGVGGLFYLKEGLKLRVEARNNLGLQDLSKLPVFGNGKIKTNSTALLVGFMFSL